MSSTKAEFTVEDISPLILYDDKWSAGNKVTDPLAGRYSTNSTFTLCTENGASATFIFNGSSITIAGAKRSNHGPYSINLDGQVTSSDGVGNDQFQTPLFQRSDLSETSQHTLVITNLESDSAKPFLDIDFIKWTTTTKGDGSQLVLEDNSGQFSYSPDSAWSTDVSGLPGYSSNNGHFTRQKGAKATLNFKGDVVQLIGSVGPDHGSMTVQIDGGAAKSLSLQKTNYQAQTVLFHASGLGAGNHTVVVAPASTGASGLIAIDQAKIWNYDGPDSSSSSGIATGAIAGIAVGAVAVIAIIAILVWFFWWRKRDNKKGGPVPQSSSFTIDTFGAPQTAQTSQTMGSRPAVSEYSYHSTGSQPMFHNPESNYAQSTYPLPNPHSDAASSAHLAYENESSYGGGSSSGAGSSYGGYGRQTSTRSRGGASNGHGTQHSMSSAGQLSPQSQYPTGGSFTSMPTPTASGGAGSNITPVTYPPEKGRRLPTPAQPTNRPSDRLVVSGREQDGGPAPSALLPPAYEQATEPYRGEPR